MFDSIELKFRKLHFCGVMGNLWGSNCEVIGTYAMLVARYRPF